MKAPLPKTQDIEIDEVRYQIVRMNPLVGSWLAAQLFTLMMPAQMEAQFIAELSKAGEVENFVPTRLPERRKQMSEDEFHNLQNHCLMCCRWYDDSGGKSLAVPVMTPAGQFVAPGLSDDVLVVLALTLHSLFFNLKPFFDQGRMKAITESFTEIMGGSNPVASILSMRSASGQ